LQGWAVELPVNQSDFDLRAAPASIFHSANASPPLARPAGSLACK